MFFSYLIKILKGYLFEKKIQAESSTPTKDHLQIVINTRHEGDDFRR